MEEKSGGVQYRMMDGLLVEGTRPAFPCPSLELRRLERMGVPMAFFNGCYNKPENAVYVGTDGRQAGYEPTSCLISRRCRRIGGLFKSDNMQESRPRLRCEYPWNWL